MSDKEYIDFNNNVDIRNNQERALNWITSGKPFFMIKDEDLEDGSRLLEAASVLMSPHEIITACKEICLLIVKDCDAQKEIDDLMEGLEDL